MAGLSKSGICKLAVINTHPIQYFAPFYAELTRQWDGKICVIYASRRGLVDTLDKGFGCSFKWDINLLSGYDWRFIGESDENAGRSSADLRCESLARHLSDLAPDAVLVHGYSDPVAAAAFKWASINKCKIFVRGDTWTGRGERRGWLRRHIKRYWLKKYYVPRVSKFLYVGKRNAAYWREVGASEEQLAWVPYGIDSERFCPASDSNERDMLRRKYGFSPDSRIIGYFGKFIHKKGIYQFLKELARSVTSQNNIKLILVGDGPLREKIEVLKTNYPINIDLLGYRNQNEIADLYRITDLVIVPSVYEETWGFAVQEALACGTPVLASDAAGCVPDLILPEQNGWALTADAWEEWAKFICNWIDGKRSINTEDVRKLACTVPGFKCSAEALVKVLEGAEPA